MTITTQDIVTIGSLVIAFGSVISTTILGFKSSNLQKELKDVEIKHNEKIQNLRCNHEKEIEEIKKQKEISLRILEEKIKAFSSFNELIISFFNPHTYEETITKVKKMRSLIFRLRLHIPEKKSDLINLADLLAGLARNAEEYKSDWDNSKRVEEEIKIRKIISSIGEEICEYLPNKLG